jgi:hypothetical protein
MTPRSAPAHPRRSTSLELFPLPGTVRVRRRADRHPDLPRRPADPPRPRLPPRVGQPPAHGQSLGAVRLAAATHSLPTGLLIRHTPGAVTTLLVVMLGVPIVGQFVPENWQTVTRYLVPETAWAMFTPNGNVLAAGPGAVVLAGWVAVVLGCRRGHLPPPRRLIASSPVPVAEWGQDCCPLPADNGGAGDRGGEAATGVACALGYVRPFRRVLVAGAVLSRPGRRPSGLRGHRRRHVGRISALPVLSVAAYAGSGRRGCCSSRSAPWPWPASKRSRNFLLNRRNPMSSPSPSPSPIHGRRRWRSSTSGSDTARSFPRCLTASASLPIMPVSWVVKVPVRVDGPEPVQRRPPQSGTTPLRHASRRSRAPRRESG